MATLRRASAFAASATVLLCAVLAGCAANMGPGPETAAAPEPARKPGVKIALLLPLGGYGQPAIIGKAMKQAAEMAVFDLNDPGVQLIVKDDRSTPEGARAATEEAVKEGAMIVLGPLQSKAVPGAASAAKAANVPVLAFSNDPATAGGGVYLMSFLVEPEVERIVAYAASQGRKRFAALLPDDPYGRAIEPAFRKAVQASGGSVADLRYFTVGANGLLGPAKQVFASIKDGEAGSEPVDALFAPGGPEVLPNLGPMLAYSGVDTAKVKLLGTGAWEFPNVGQDPAIAGGWYPGPDPAGWRSFAERFAKTFGPAPPRVASLAYDAVKIAAALSNEGTGSRFGVESLTRREGFTGVDGAVTFSANGMSRRALAVLEVQKFGSVVIDPAGLAFAPTPVSQAATASPARLN